ncbi:MAG: proteasome ATPase [Bifidobacterium sp.]
MSEHPQDDQMEGRDDSLRTDLTDGESADVQATDGTEDRGTGRVEGVSAWQPPRRNPMEEDSLRDSDESSASRLSDMAAQLDLSQRKNHALAAALTKAAEELGKAKSQMEQLAKPPMSFAVFISQDRISLDSHNVRHATAEIALSNRRMIVPVAPNVDLQRATCGESVLLNENMVLVEFRGRHQTGQVRSVLQVIDMPNLVVQDSSGAASVVTRAGKVMDTRIVAGDRVILDDSGHIALDLLPAEDETNLVLEETPDVSYADIGGLDSQIDRIRDAVQLPFEHRELFERYDLRPPKGVLLYGPPGNGKTMIAKAVAHSLAQGTHARRGIFLSVKGPELLNKFVGESERLIRGIFKRARERAAQGALVIVFIDEMDSLLRTRGSGVSSDVETTIVPQFLAELDGVEALDNVIVIGASNRVDMIDPAVLRPGRLDVKIRVDRPNKAQATSILRHYLTNDLPLQLDRDSESLASSVVSDAFSRGADRKVCDVCDERGQWTSVFFADVISGAMLKNIVDRAKTKAVKASIESGSDVALGESILADAVQDEFVESADSIGDADPSQWSNITGLDVGRVVRIERGRESEGRPA